MSWFRSIKHSYPIVIFSLITTTPVEAARISDVDRFQHNDGSLNLYLRGTYINTEIENKKVEGMLGDIPGGKVQGASAISAILDYNSPYYSKIIGLDASIYAVGKLNSEDSNRSILNESNEGFGKLGQASFKAKHSTDNSDLYLQIGRGRFDGGVISTRDTRAVPDSYEGSKLTFNSKNIFFPKIGDNLKTSYTYISKASLRNEKDFSSIRTVTGSEIDSVQSLSIEYDAKLASIRYSYGLSKDYLSRNETELNLRIPLSDDYKDGFLINAQLHKVKNEGSLWDTSLSAVNPLKPIDAFDDTSELINVNTGFQIGNLRAGVSVTDVKAKLTNGKLGYAFIDNAENVIGSRSMWTISGNDFNNDGETTYQIAAEYNIPGFRVSDFFLSGINIRAILKKGTFDASNPFTGGITEKVTEDQKEFRLYYRFDQKDYSGLSVGLSYSDYNIDKEFVALVSAQPEAVVSAEEMRIYMDYAF